MENVKNCARCGIKFYKPKRYSDAQWNTRNYCSRRCAAIKLEIPPEKIESMYKGGMSSTEIAAELGTSATHILRLMSQHGIDKRSASEGKKLALSKPEVREKISKSGIGRNMSEATKKKLSESISGSKNAQWKGGMAMSVSGYLGFTNSKANGEHAGKLLHQIIAQWKYGRAIGDDEHVHHIDGNKLNNNPENLVILSAEIHAKLHTQDKKNGKRRKSM